MQGEIHIVGLGPGSKEYISLGALDLLKNNNNVYLRTEKHPTVDFLKQLGIKYQSFDHLYQTKETFDDVYNNIVDVLLLEADKGKKVVYAVPGSPFVAEKTVELILKKVENKEKVNIAPSISFLDIVLQRLKLSPNEVKLVDALNLDNTPLDGNPIIITQIYNRLVASETKIRLMEVYPDDHEVFMIKAAGIKGMEKIKSMPLYEIDRQDWIDHLTSLYVPKVGINQKQKFNIRDLISIMASLRGEKGCPWDKKQTHETLVEYLIEETYEVIEAIDEKNEDKLKEELGDLLLQIVFHCRLAQEKGEFEFDDVVTEISRKMIRRHPHVFGVTEVNSTQQVLKNWDKIKRKEKGVQSHAQTMRDIPQHLPALMRASKVQEKAAAVGFDWEKAEVAHEKLVEEVNELKEVYNSGNRGKIKEEIGDVLFAAVNVARLLKIQPELALKDTIDKFINRFTLIETLADSADQKIEEMTLMEMDMLWEKAKQMLNQEKNNKKRQV